MTRFDVSVVSDTEERNGRAIFVHRFYGLGEPLETSMALIIHDILVQLSPQQTRLLLSFYPLREEQWREIEKSDWTTLVHTPCETTRRRWFGVEARPSWCVGYAHSTTKFAAAFTHAWNINHNDAFAIVAAPLGDDGTLLASMREILVPDNEASALDFYRIAALRYHDGLCLTVVSTDHDGPSVQQTLRGVISKAEARGVD